MATVHIKLPSLLERFTDGQRVIEVQATTVADAITALTERHPELGVHLFDETGGFREHVLCFHNEANTRWMESLDAPVSDGDTVTIMQAVSGG
jgi:molybdopterin converting factor small subunit